MDKGGHTSLIHIKYGFWISCKTKLVIGILLLASERIGRDPIRDVQIRAGAVRIYMYVWRYICHNISACHVYIMWAELGHSHFLYVPTVLNVVTNGNGTGTNNVLKETVRFGLSLVSILLSSRRYYCSESNTILYLDTVYCKFLLYVSIEINPFKHRYFITQTNLVYLGIVCDCDYWDS